MQRESHVMPVHQNDTRAPATKKVIDHLPSDELLGELELRGSFTSVKML
jgi:hypothetical protein